MQMPVSAPIMLSKRRTGTQMFDDVDGQTDDL